MPFNSISNRSVEINFVVALDIEAKPFIEEFGLKLERRQGGFKLYVNNGTQLIVCGIGKTNAAAATAYLAATCSDAKLKSSLWINAGIAGHQSLELGTTLVANKIVEVESGKTFYPMLFSSEIKSDLLYTVDSPETSYVDNCAYDMEASGFFSVAAKFASLELIQSVKVVSDNQESSIQSLSKKDIASYMKLNLQAVMQLIPSVFSVTRNINVARAMPEAYEAFLSDLALSVTQKEQLKRLCQRYCALGLQSELESLNRTHFRSAKQLIASMTQELSSRSKFVE